MEIGKVRVGGTTIGSLPISQQDRENLRLRRNAGLQKIKIVGIVIIMVSTLTIAAGIGTLVVGSRGEISWPVFNFGPLLVGILMFIAGLLAVMADRSNVSSSNYDETPTGVKGYFIGYYVLSITCMSLTCIAATFAFLSAGICGRDYERKEQCYPERETIVAFAIAGGVLSVVLAIFCLISCIFFCLYARSMGFKNRYERAMEMQMGMMMRAMQENQQAQWGQYGGQPGQFQGQPGQFQGQPGQGQWGQFGGQQGPYQGQPPQYETKY